MTAPATDATGTPADAPMSPPSRVCVQVLAKRSDFLRAAQARRQSMPGFLVQARNRHEDSATIRIGFTCSKKIGNAVARNRAKRRLRAIARAVLPAGGQPGWDYVLVGRPQVTIGRGYALLLDDLTRALAQIHAAGRRP